MRKWSKKEIIKDLRLRAKEIGHSPSQGEIPSALYGACNWHFGCINKAKKSAGLETYKLKYNPLKRSAYKLSKEFVYVLGVIYGDGSINLQENNHGSSGAIQLKVRENDFALYFKRVIEKWSGLNAKHYLDKDNFYNIRVNSVDACRIIENFDLDSILKLKKEFQFEFLKGLFDSDGGITGENLDNRKYAKRWLHFSNNNLMLIKLVNCIFDKMQIKYSVIKRIHSGFGSKKWQYEIKVYNLNGIFKYYKNVSFSIKRKQDKLKEVINSYDYYPLETFNKAKQLHKKMGFRKVAKELNLNCGIVYGWLFKNNQKQILDVKGGKNERNCIFYV